jgi:hypothetical protein
VPFAFAIEGPLPSLCLRQAFAIEEPLPLQGLFLEANAPHIIIINGLL